MLYAVIVRIDRFKLTTFEKLSNILPKYNNENVYARDECRAKPLKKTDPCRAYFSTFKVLISRG